LGFWVVGVVGASACRASPCQSPCTREVTDCRTAREQPPPTPHPFRALVVDGSVASTGAAPAPGLAEAAVPVISAPAANPYAKFVEAAVSQRGLDAGVTAGGAASSAGAGGNGYCLPAQLVWG
jgi:hypothetical protein